MFKIKKYKMGTSTIFLSLSKILFINIILYCTFSLDAAYITYDLNGGRLGDNIFNYCRCNWLAHKYNLQFIPTPFPLSDYFFQAEEPPEDLESIKLKEEAEIKRHENENVILHSILRLKTDDLFNVMMKNEEFVESMKKTFCKLPTSYIDIPQDHVSVAIHIRKGSAQDPPCFSKGLEPEQLNITQEKSFINNEAKSSSTQVEIDKKMQRRRRILPHKPKPRPKPRPKPKHYADRIWPLKFPPNDYYTELLENLIQLFPHRKLFVHIFTDHQNPKHLKDLFEERFAGNDKVIFACRDNETGNNNCIIDDFLSMMHFDCLIRSESNFARMAHFLGSHLIIIHPISFKWAGKKLHINEVELIYKSEDTRIIFEKKITQNTYTTSGPLDTINL